jgi:hypothetical protein
MDGVGNLYGTARGGGVVNGAEVGGGVVYQLTHGPNGWTQTVLHSFCSESNCADGRSPYQGLVMDASGNLYGTTAEGGAVNDTAVNGGVAYELTPGPNGWTETVLHTFCSQPRCCGAKIPADGA